MRGRGAAWQPVLLSQQLRQAQLEGGTDPANGLGILWPLPTALQVAHHCGEEGEASAYGRGWRAVPLGPLQALPHQSWAPRRLGRACQAGATARPALAAAHGRSGLDGLGLAGTPAGEGRLRKRTGRRCPESGRWKGEYWMSEAEGGVTQRKGLPAPDLSIAQHRVSALHGRHGQRQTIQAPQQAAEVVVATHCSCQGLLTGAGGLRGGEKTIGRAGPHRRAGRTRRQPCCCRRARGPPAGHSGKCSLAKVRAALQPHSRPHQIQPHRLLTQPSLALTPALNQGPHLFQALDQRVQEAPRIVDTGIWNVSVAGKGAQRVWAVGARQRAAGYEQLTPKAWARAS